jgi:hypothetical protein
MARVGSQRHRKKNLIITALSFVQRKAAQHPSLFKPAAITVYAVDFRIPDFPDLSFLSTS